MQQQLPIPAPAPPPPPPLPEIPGIVNPATLGLIPGMPLSDAQREAIEVARDRMSDQLISASGRRDAIAEALKTAQGADRAGLEQRLIQLDQRILQIESDLAETGRILTAAPPNGDPFTSVGFAPGSFDPSPGLSPGNITAISIIFILAVLMPIAMAAARLMWRRATGPRPAAPSLESVQRLERVEHAIVAVSV